METPSETVPATQSVETNDRKISSQQSSTTAPLPAMSAAETSQQKSDSINTNTGTPRNWGERIPFLALLYLRSNVDESNVIGDDDEDMNNGNLLINLLLWKRPVLSGLWLLVCNLGFYLLHIAGYSVLTLVCLLTLWQMIANRLVKHSIQLLQKWKALDDKTIDAELFVLCTSTITSRSIQEFADLSYDLSLLFQRLWVDIICNANLLKVFILVRLTSYALILEPADFETSLWLMAWALFTIPVALDSSETPRVLSSARLALQNMSSLMSSKIEGVNEIVKKMESQAREDYEEETASGAEKTIAISKARFFFLVSKILDQINKGLFNAEVNKRSSTTSSRASDLVMEENLGPRIVSWKNRERVTPKAEETHQ